MVYEACIIFRVKVESNFGSRGYRNSWKICKILLYSKIRRKMYDRRNIIWGRIKFWAADLPRFSSLRHEDCIPVRVTIVILYGEFMECRSFIWNENSAHSSWSSFRRETSSYISLILKVVSSPERFITPSASCLHSSRDMICIIAFLRSFFISLHEIPGPYFSPFFLWTRKRYCNSEITIFAKCLEWIT